MFTTTIPLIVGFLIIFLVWAYVPCLFLFEDPSLNPLAIIKNQTSEICLAAVKQDGTALQYVKEQTPEICLEAVKQNGFALKYVKKQTAEICLAAVKQESAVLKYVKKQTPEICLAVFKSTPIGAKKNEHV